MTHRSSKIWAFNQLHKCAEIDLQKSEPSTNCTNVQKIEWIYLPIWCQELDDYDDVITWSPLYFSIDPWVQFTEDTHQ